MGLKHLRLSLAIVLPIFAAGAAQAAPTLRLTTAAVGPITVAAGSNGSAQTVEAYNNGDGTLALSVSSSATWLTGSVQAQRACSSRSGNCFPIVFALNTSSLAAGTYTALATVSDPNAVDAPQTITVTVQVGGGVPSSVTVYTAPNSFNDYSFSTNSPLSTQTSTSDSNSWLSVSLDGAGSFRFVLPYRIHVAPVSGQGAGSYTGKIITSGSAFAGDNKTIPVTMQVTTQPILQLQPDIKPVHSVTDQGIQVKLAQGAPRYDLSLILKNLGMGTLTVASATSSGGSWLAVVTAPPAYVIASLDPTNLNPGTYTGSVTVNSNSAAGALVLPVQLTVVAKGAPVLRFQGAVDNAVFTAGDPVCPGDILALFGDQLSFAPATLGSAPPLSTTIGGATVLVNGKAAPMYYSTYGQLAFQLPVETPAGTATIQVQRDGQSSNTITVNVVARAPRLLRIGIGDYGAIVNQDYSLPMPSSYQVPGFKTRPAKRGETLTIYAIGLGATSPEVGTGQAAPANPLAWLSTQPTVSFGSAIVGTGVAVPLFAGLTPSSAGLYQINVTIPGDAPSGTVSVTANFPGASSNPVLIAVE